MFLYLSILLFLLFRQLRLLAILYIELPYKQGIKQLKLPKRYHYECELSLAHEPVGKLVNRNQQSHSVWIIRKQYYLGDFP